MWLLIDSRSDTKLDKEFAGRVRFIKLDPKSKAAEDAMTEFSILKPPASILANAKGCVVEKIEGRATAIEMRGKLKALAGKQGG